MTGAALLALVQALLPAGVAVDEGGEAAIAPLPGAYALCLHLAQPLDFVRPGLSGVLPIGWYVYAGSARGAGGMRARLGRHLRRDKPVHWHVDEVTRVAAARAALAIAGGDECAIVTALLASGQFAPALAGFGSSDCRHCPAHLLRLTG